MASDTISSRYAEALFELGEEHDCVEQFRDELDGLVEMFDESDDFREVLLNPGIDIEERRRAIRAVADELDLMEMVANFVMTLLDNDRIRKLRDIAEAYRGRVDEEQGRVRANLTTAIELDDDQRGQLQEVLSEMTGRDVVLETDVDPELLGGAVTRVDGVVYDGSVRNQLNNLRDQILEQV